MALTTNIWKCDSWRVGAARQVFLQNLQIYSFVSVSRNNFTRNLAGIAVYWS